MEEEKQNSTAGQEKKKKGRWVWIFSTLAFLVALGAGGAAFYFYQKYRTAQQAVLESKNFNETESLVKKVGQLMDLPGDEQPAIATVTDKSKLEDKPFFKKAENGDKILIYAKWAKAIVYRPSAEKIIEVMPVSIANPDNAQKAAEEAKSENNEQEAQKTAEEANNTDKAPAVQK